MNRCTTNTMKRLSILSVSAMMALGLALLPSAAQQKTLKEQLVGTWTLVSTEVTPPTGPKRQYFGANPRGILMLDAGGRYAQVWGRADRPKFSLDTPAAEYGEAARAFVGNFGTWTVNEADKTLTQRYEAALIPNAEGTEAKVSVSLAGDELKFVATSATGERIDTVYGRAK